MPRCPDEPDDEYRAWVQRLRDQSRRDAESLVPRPDYPVYGLAAPTLTPAVLLHQSTNGFPVLVSLRYGSWETATGPHVTVTSAAPHSERRPASATPGVPASFTDGRSVRDPESDLLREIDAERKRVAVYAGVDLEVPPEPPSYTREALPMGDALVCRHGTMWAARLIDGSPEVIVTITGHGADADGIRLEPVTDLAPMLAARNEEFGRRRERRRATPPPVLEPAEGVAAWRALADFCLASDDRIREAERAGREPRTPIGSGPMRAALWQRAVRERQRLAGGNARAAEDVVTSVINHLVRLGDRAAWFGTDARLREAAIDETLRRALLADSVPSEPAQQAWDLYWSEHLTWLRVDPQAAERLAQARARETLADDWLRAWADWAATA
jgi:hypothetical protein